MSWTKRVVGILIVVAVFVLGRWSTEWWGSSATAPDGATAEHDHSSMEGSASASSEPTLWTCPMHPEIKMPEAGDCPKCGMDLVPMQKGDDTGPRQLAMSPAAVALANIQTAPVTRQFLTMPVRMVGKVDYDETRVKTIAARVEGRLDRLYVDYTGVSVKKKDHLVWLYSPSLLTAQQELLEAKKRLSATSGEASAFLPGSNQRGYESAREKLILWGLTPEQVDAIEERGKAEDHVLIQSPAAGVVIHKALKEGDYVKEGTPIYRIADLSQLWILLDAYEQDLPWLRYGQSVSVNTEAFPGEIFEGWISFVDPTVDEATRTVRVRVNVANPDGKLKPGMFARAVVQSRIGTSGQVLEPRLRGKWISPMHPEVVKDGPGKCDVCGMDLVPAESFLGKSEGRGSSKPLVVPASAVLVTGTRAVVYVEVPGKKKPTYEGREIVLGPRAGDHYIVRAGLVENEQVVVNGAFRLDSSMQIQAKPSMMSMRGDANTFTGPSTAVFRLSLSPLYGAYSELQKALAGDDPEASRRVARKLQEAIDQVNPGGLSREASVRWEEERMLLALAAKKAVESSSLASLRRHFGAISRGVLTLERTFRHAGDTIRYEAFCPMAFDNKGGSWLQIERDIRNPYFGSSMLSCGEVRTEFVGVAEHSRPATGETKSKEPELGTEPVKKPPASQPTTTEEMPTAKAVAHVHGLEAIFTSYLSLQTALAGDDPRKSHGALGEMRRAAADARVHFGKGPSETASKALEKLRLALNDPAQATLDALRPRFEIITAKLLELHDTTGHTLSKPLYRMHCSMAFDNKGADWLQQGKTLANPYFGASMLRCGSVKQEIPAVGVTEHSRPATGETKSKDPEPRTEPVKKRPASKPPTTKEKSTAKAVAHVHGLEAIFTSYLSLQTALAGDDPRKSHGAFGEMRRAAADARVHSGKGPSETASKALEKLRQALKDPAKSTLDVLRPRFETVTAHLLELHGATGHTLSKPLYRMHCSMAFDNKGADWLQQGKTLANPYFGASMLRCGSVKQELPAVGKK